jgi:hypothetical protein
VEREKWSFITEAVSISTFIPVSPLPAYSINLSIIIIIYRRRHSDYPTKHLSLLDAAMRPLFLLSLLALLTPIESDCIACRYGASSVVCPQPAGTDGKFAMTDFACLCSKQSDFERVLASCYRNNDLPSDCSRDDQDEFNRIRSECKARAPTDQPPSKTTQRMTETETKTVVFSSLTGQKTELVSVTDGATKTYTVTNYGTAAYYDTSIGGSDITPRITRTVIDAAGVPSTVVDTLVGGPTSGVGDKPTDNTEDPVKIAEIIGGCIGGSIGVVIVGIIVFKVQKKKKKQEKKRREEEVKAAIHNAMEYPSESPVYSAPAELPSTQKRYELEA